MFNVPSEKTKGKDPNLHKLQITQQIQTLEGKKRKIVRWTEKVEYSPIDALT